MSYATYDFVESLSRVTRFKREEIESVEMAWGRGDGMGKGGEGLGWSLHGVSDWNGGFLLKMKDKTWIYLSGWCDYTGWGCQDGITYTVYDRKPHDLELHGERERTPPMKDWDVKPADLNRWLVSGEEEA